VSKRSIIQRVGIVVGLTLVSIVLHEFGHFLVYKAAGVPVRISLQSVRPIGTVRGWWGPGALLAGPALSWIAAIVCLVIATKRPSFAWATASFTNASIRLFPCSMDLVRALQNGPPFSDEGNVAQTLTQSPVGRAGIVSIAIALSLTLAILAARQFHFVRRGALKSVGVYVLSLAVGIAVVIVDELVNR
jgi:hypothetical protein